jgi:hypothetical protein|nr:MAG TPA: hypothetical protein [Caudoviricetes sp.]
MKQTVIFDGHTGDVIAVTGECDVEHVEALILEVPDGMRVEAVNVSGENPEPVMSETPATLQVQLQNAIKRSDEMRAELKADIMRAINEALQEGE